MARQQTRKPKVKTPTKKPTLKTQNKDKLRLWVLAAVFGLAGIIYLATSSAGPQAAYISSADISLSQPTDLNLDGMMDITTVPKGTHPTERNNIPADSITINIKNIQTVGRISNKSHAYFAFVDCMTNKTGLSQYGSPTRTWIATNIPVTQSSITVNSSHRVDEDALDGTTYHADLAWLKDLYASGGKCKVDLGLFNKKSSGLAAMSNYAWFPYSEASGYFTTHPHGGHPNTYELKSAVN